MPSMRYEFSKEILPGSERPNFRYLNLIREREARNASLVFRVFASITERPAMIEVGDTVFYPESFRDARDAQRVFFSVNSFNEFMAAVERKSKPRRNMVPMGGGDDDIMMEQPDNYDNL